MSSGQRGDFNQPWLAIVLLLLASMMLSAPRLLHAQSIIAPAGSSPSFGTTVKVLPNGNLLVTDPNFSIPGASQVGAVYLYRPDRSLISRVTGSTSSDRIGREQVLVLPNSNVVLSNPDWDNGGVADVGAVTFINGASGLNGVVSAANSLVGTRAGDQLGRAGIELLANGNYVVVSPRWDNGPQVDAGAVTWGSGTQGVVGPVSAQNSIVGTSAGDQVGGLGNALTNGVVPLSNGHFVVTTLDWDNGAVADVGAVTWGSGAGSTTGAVSPSNSLIGGTAGDRIGSQSVGSPTGSVLALSAGNYVVGSVNWDNGPVVDAGAATWVDGSAPTAATVGPSNSLVGSSANDRVGTTIVPLTNGHYVVASPSWDASGNTNAGAVTWRNGFGPFPAAVGAANSLVGVASNHLVGGSNASGSLAALRNGNFVLAIAGIDGPSAASFVGAVIWVNGATGATGPVSGQSALLGSSPGDSIGAFGGLLPLVNGHYVICSRAWSNGGAAGAGAATWADGSLPLSGTVSAANSLVGSTTNDRVCNFGVLALTSGHYVVISSDWNNGAAIDAGAATWGNDLGGTTGAVSPANSLVGTSAGDQIGQGGRALVLDDGNYVIASRFWDDGLVQDVGAVTWGDGSAGTVGAVSATNSLIGSTMTDQVGDSPAGRALPGGHYSVISTIWDSASTVNAAAASLGVPGGTTVGPVGPGNSIEGVITNSVNGSTDWDHTRDRLAVGIGSAVAFVSYDTISFDGFEE